MEFRSRASQTSNFIGRIQAWFALVIIIMAVFILRAFYVQVIKHNYYSHAALAGQLKEYEVLPVRGEILGHNGGGTLPIVLNETLYTLFADPKFITDSHSVADRVQQVIGGKASDYEKTMNQNTRYAVLAKKLTKDQKTKLDNLGIKGLGTREEPHRTYPEGSLAAQLLGFVNDDGQGKYGIEQYLNDKLAGQPGELKAITDAQGVPLLSNPDNVIKQPQNGKSVLLTIDIPMQKLVEDILAKGLKADHAASGSVLIMDPNTGAIKAMANLPSFNPAKFYEVKDANDFNNINVSSPLEVGSVMKTLTVASALNQGVINPNTTYFDPGKFVIDGHTITNVEEEGGSATRSIKDILQLSLNTGATWIFMQMGGGHANAQARNIWYDYMSNRYQLGKPTGIEQGYEATGNIPDPNKGFGLDIQFANTAFGQGLSMTPLQLGAALSSVINGGTYYKPTLVDAVIDQSDNQIKNPPVVVKQNVVKTSVSRQIQALMEYVVSKNHVLYGLPNLPPSIYNIGGKTGTAQITKPDGGYYSDRFNGMFIGFVGGDKPEYVIVVRVNEPHVFGYAGAHAAAPIFSKLALMLINDIGVAPKTH